MLRELLENKLTTKLLIISDTKNAIGSDLFICALRNEISSSSKGKINLICYERPPSCYLSSSCDGNVIVHNPFADPLGWNDPSTPPWDLSPLTSASAALADDVFFLDSFTLLAQYRGYGTAYGTLSVLKSAASRTVCVVHSDVLDEERMEEIRFLATGFISVGVLGEGSVRGNVGERMGEVAYRKPGGKVMKRREVFCVDEDLIVRSRTSEGKVQKKSSEKEEFEGLTTFSLGLKMSERERKAKEELVLPYVKGRGGDIIYEAEDDELEEDPDDDLDI